MLTLFSKLNTNDWIVIIEKIIADAPALIAEIIKIIHDIHPSKQTPNLTAFITLTKKH